MSVPTMLTTDLALTDATDLPIADERNELAIEPAVANAQAENDEHAEPAEHHAPGMVGAGACDPREAAGVRHAPLGRKIRTGRMVVVVGGAHRPTLVAPASAPILRSGHQSLRLALLPI